MKIRANGLREIAEAAEWRLLALLLQRPRPGWHEEVAALGRELADDRLRAAADAAADADEGSYLALLGPSGFTSPRLVAHLPLADPGLVLSEIAACGEAFGFHPRAEDPPDHVAVLCDLVSYLLLKEAYARVGNQREAAGVARDARRHALETWLAPVAGPLAEQLTAVTSGYLADAARRLRARVPAAPPRSLGPRLAAPAACCPAPEQE